MLLQPFGRQIAVGVNRGRYRVVDRLCHGVMLLDHRQRRQRLPLRVALDVCVMLADLRAFVAYEVLHDGW